MALSDGDIVRLTLKGRNDAGALQMNSLHYKLVGDTAFLGNEPTVADTCSKLWSYVGTAYQNILPAAYFIDSVHGYTEVETWNGDVASSGDFNVNTNGILTNGAAQIPRPTCCVVDLKSDVASRSARGWILCPAPINPAHYDGTGKIAGSIVTTYATFTNLLDDNIQHTVLGVNAWHLHPVIYSRTRRKRGSSPYVFDVKSAQVRTDPRWLNRRRTIP